MHMRAVHPLPRRTTGLLLAVGLTLSACGGAAQSGQPPGSEAMPSASEAPMSAEPMPASPDFSFGSDEPTVSREMTGIDEAYINPGAVIEHQGTLHMFANVFTAWPGLVRIPHLTSTDGVSWTLDPAEPVLTSDEIDFGAPGADVSTGFVTDDGTWVLIFSTVSSLDPWVLGRATAPAPEGPWTIDPEPILEPGPEGSWDAGGLSWPAVLRTDEGYNLYYTAVAAPRGDGVIGLATSADGVTWTKRDEPVLVAEADWEKGSLDRARVAAIGDGRYLMVYTGYELTERGVAFSTDGVTWTRSGEAPVITSDDFPVSGRCWDAALVNVDGTLHYYLEIGSATASQGTQVYLATAEAP